MSGGAALGAFQAGVIDVLARRAVVPDLIVGTSIGAINGACWAFNPGAAAGQRLLDLWLRAGASRLLLRRLPVIRHLVTGRGYLVDNLDLQRVIVGVLGESARIEDSAVPLAIVATEATGGGRRVLRERDRCCRRSWPRPQCPESSHPSRSTVSSWSTVEWSQTATWKRRLRPA